MNTPHIRRWPGYNMILRWHFYAGLLCLPFIVWLSLTGAVYLFKPQIEAAIDAPYRHVAASPRRARPSEQVAAAVRAVPGSVLHRYQLPGSSDDAVQILVGVGAQEKRVYVHPESLSILKVVDEDKRLMRMVFNLHGELMAGAWGSYIVELAASWTIIMILTGLFLWWPRGAGLAGTLYPRLRGDRRRFWRDLHAVTGLWVSFFALFLLVSGLPWAKSWGAYLKTIRAVAEGQTPRQDWTTSKAEELRMRAMQDAGTRAMLGEHAEHGGMAMMHPMTSYRPLDRLAITVGTLELAPPVLIAPPTGMDQPWTAKSDAANRPLRTDLKLDGATGRVISRKDFAQRKLVDRLVGYGVAVHEGQLFGIANQIVNLMTAIGLVLMSVSSVVLWWRRRPGGTLGAPVALSRPPMAVPFFLLVGLLAISLPLFGATLVAVLMIERLVLSRLPPVRTWLGLRAA